MDDVEVIAPASGCRLVKTQDLSLLFGQPPEALKGLLRHQIDHFDGLVIIDTRERDGSLLNHVEFLLYYFLFELGGYSEGRKLHLIGNETAIRQVKRVLKLCLLGPDPEQLNTWDTDPALAKEWLAVSQDAALKDANQQILTIDDFFQTHVFQEESVSIGGFTLEHTGWDQYTIKHGDSALDLNLDEDQRITPSYPVQRDNHAAPLAKFSLEVLGGASGFSPNEPCTGLALCYNGEYLLIDVIPFLDEHLIARGISKNQISSCFLTHVHDDHCALFPLMQCGHKVEIITTLEIYQMALEKLALSLDWSIEVVAEHFSFVPIAIGQALNHYGLIIEAHTTVHSVPTIGATFTVRDAGKDKRICVIGDNHALKKIKPLVETSVVRHETLSRLETIYQEPFDLLIADGGAGPLHGDPKELITSLAERVVFVHIDQLPEEFTATFSLASAGKRYNLIEGSDSLYGALIQHYLSNWIGEQGSDRWLRNLVTNATIKHFNLEDVILVQGQPSRGNVYLILTGYCSVVHHDTSTPRSVATLQAGDLIGEMAVLTDLGARNASVIAKTPVVLCEFSEDVFTALAAGATFRTELTKRWQLRPVIKTVKAFRGIHATVVEKLTAAAEKLDYPAGSDMTFSGDNVYFKVHGNIRSDDSTLESAEVLGAPPFAQELIGTASAVTDTQFLQINRIAFERVRLSTPQLNYQYRKFLRQTATQT